jgi:hypothetical protein
MSMVDRIVLGRAIFRTQLLLSAIYVPSNTKSYSLSVETSAYQYLRILRRPA